MKLNPLATEILGWNRSDDNEPAVPTANVSGEEADVLDSTRPFSDLFEYQPATGRANDLVKRAENVQLVTDILGEDAPVVTPKPTRLDLAIARVANLITTKVASAAINAPLRKQAVSGILSQFRAELVRKGYRAGVEAFDGWNNLQAHAEKFVVDAVAAV